MWTLGRLTLEPEPPFITQVLATSIQLEWTELPLGDHDAPVEGYKVRLGIIHSGIMVVALLF